MTDLKLSPEEEEVIREEWSRIQENLREHHITTDQISQPVTHVAGVDISFIKDNQIDACASYVILSYPDLVPVYVKYQMVKLTQPYIPTYLAFREVDHLVSLILEQKATQPELTPQLIFVDGNGYLHPRKFGLACHLGVLVNLPTIGVGKNFYALDGLTINGIKDQTMTECPNKGEWLEIKGESNTCWGASLATNDHSRKPLYVSIGHRVSLPTAVDWVKAVSKYRIPEPIRQADLGSREYLRNI